MEAIVHGGTGDHGTTWDRLVLGQIRTLFSLGRVGDRADGEILEAFKTHQTEAEAAFAELVARHGAMVLEVCRRVLREPQDVDDAFQATFLILVRRAGGIRNCDALGGWLHRVALRVALRAKSEALHRREVELPTITPAEEEVAGDDDLERAEIRRVLHEELDRIPSAYRTALVTCYLEGLTHEEAANRLGLPVGTVRSRLSRGRERLRAAGSSRSSAWCRPFCPRRSSQAGAGGFIREGMRRDSCPRCEPVWLRGSLARAAGLAEKVIQAMHVRTFALCGVVALMFGVLVGLLPFVTMVRASHVRSAEAQAPAVEPPIWGAMAGVVRDADGRPVAGATVIGGFFSERQSHLVTTSGPAGRFAFKATKEVEKLNYALAYKAGYAPAGKLLFAWQDRPVPGDVELVLQKPEACVGVVQDRDGRPIAGASVRVRYMRGGPGKDGKREQYSALLNVLHGSPLESLLVTTTDKRGNFRFAAVPSPQAVVLNASRDGMADLSTEVPGNFEAGFISGTEAKPARLIMEPEARVVGKLVTRMPGVSVAGIKVGLQSTSNSALFWRDAVTDAQGRFEMGALPEGGANVFPYDHPSDGPWTYQAIENLSLHPGKRAEVTIELIEGVLVEGKLTDLAPGKPIAGAPVGMYGPARPDSGAAVIVARTDDQGRYRYRLPVGPTRFYHMISTNRRGSVSVIIPTDAKTYAVPEIKTEQRPAPRAARPAEDATTETLLVAGLVCDVSDRPVGGALVIAALSSGYEVSPRRIVRSDPQGRFRIDRVGPRGATSVVHLCAFKEGMAPAVLATEILGGPPLDDLKVVLARARPFVGVVQQHRKKGPIGGAAVKVRSMRVPVIEGAGTTIVDIPWRIISGTPLGRCFRP